MTIPPTTRPADGPADSDIPRAPESAGAWDIRSEALLNDPPPKRSTGPRRPRTPARVSNSLLPAAGSPWRATEPSPADAPTEEAPAAPPAEPAESPESAKSSAPAETSGPPGSAEPSGSSAPAEPDRPAPPAKPRTRRGPADPVKALMHRHRELCERAVDPLEIAAGLEAHGMTDRTAARFRHRDVFSLAEELYARVPRGTEPPGGDVEFAPQPGGRTLRVLRSLLPGALCALSVTAARLTVGHVRLSVVAAGTAVVGAALAYTVRRGALRAGRGTGLPWALWLAVYAVVGDGLLDALLAGGPSGAPGHGWATDPAAAVGLTLAVAPATWCARLFAVRARRSLATSRGLDEFAARSRPLLLGAVALFLLALTLVLLIAQLAYGHGSFASAVAPGALLFLARLLALHGFATTAVAGLRAAACAEATALALVLAGRLPGCGLLARPISAAVAAGGAATVPAALCAVAALALLVRATAVLARASAHAERPPTL
ncbi:hypothetical protein [Streptomyces sp. CBMA152]|uniref:hypothetical protein n=1 Tax=Streptomyces sp. CBMA152 TaxID=1896312 RepID=UPI0016610143|nr:hypothetical protein [Streptomyces sp. CBMA152]MBD0745180.1 hypothetical protein [Streptomyces sp. CBMA152]